MTPQPTPANNNIKKQTPETGHITTDTLLVPKTLARTASQLTFSRAKRILDSSLPYGDQFIAILYLEWQDSTHCKFAVRNMTQASMMFSVCYHTTPAKDSNNKVKSVNAPKEITTKTLDPKNVAAGENGFFIWPAVDDCVRNGHSYLVVNGRLVDGKGNKFQVQHYEGDSNGRYKPMHDLWNDYQYAP
ncbi:hypothetical protein BGW39_010301 [Mortierella sp. 14UC]|nr:hypothetical protein BGW39_010301 [Mortierella sp. 14UC]